MDDDELVHTAEDAEAVVASEVSEWDERREAEGKRVQVLEAGPGGGSGSRWWLGSGTPGLHHLRMRNRLGDAAGQVVTVMSMNGTSKEEVVAVRKETTDVVGRGWGRWEVVGVLGGTKYGSAEAPPTCWTPGTRVIPIHRMR
ncbi:hypothetical protein HDU93_002788 [Gonapodya sp. JEL0774]|nr:hypothetical protein HDU93_002788 [Gonapodya sp. JEL0774]